MAKKIEIWAQGARRGNCTARAQLLGKYEAATFTEACAIHYSQLDNSLRKYFNVEEQTFCGIKVFNNEQDARKAFG